MAIAYQFSANCATPQIIQDAAGSAVSSASSNLDCLISQIEAGTVSVDWSLSQLNVEQFSEFFGGALFIWAVGLSIGLLINVVRRARL